VFSGAEIELKLALKERPEELIYSKSILGSAILTVPPKEFLNKSYSKVSLSVIILFPK